LVGTLLATFGCSSGSQSGRPGNINDDGFVISRPDAAADGEPTTAVDECSADDTQTCSIDLGEHAFIHDCITGTQVCESGHWSRCYPN